MLDLLKKLSELNMYSDSIALYVVLSILFGLMTLTSFL